MTQFSCRSETEASDLLRACASRGETIEIVGHGSKRGWGRPVRADHVLDIGGCTGITLYEPNELVLSARAGTPLAEIETALAEHGQQLAFEPMDTGPLYGIAPGRGTIGGVLLANMSGPRRVKAGAARDHVLGVKGVSGAGTIFKAGGRVVKNVTGYDLPRGLAGSWGTLALVTDITFKVLPRPQTSSTLAVFDLADDLAIQGLCRALGSPWEVSSAAHIPAETAPLLPPELGIGARSVALLRVEGVTPSVAYRTERLIEGLGTDAEIAVLEQAQSDLLWRALRDVRPFSGSDKPLWRISVAPTGAAALVRTIGEAGAIRHFHDWSGGLIWLEVLDDAPDALAGAIRRAVAETGGHASLVRGAARFADVPAFPPQPAALVALAGRLKNSLDPAGILNPARMA
ncbi:FAD-binding protein [Terrihabitans sp. B22-R8]|uniref:FAD-binding protein n=1 Tax=Terrihabitans sp. B22-R8 TaxID=3425128 RepID=UPI00403C894F